MEFIQNRVNCISTNPSHSSDRENGVCNGCPPNINRKGEDFLSNFFVEVGGHMALKYMHGSWPWGPDA